MENKLGPLSEEPRKLPFELIKHITNNFSEEIGRGAFGQVFKGVLEDGEQIAVKMLRFMPGFCDEAEEELYEYKGKLTVCQRIHRALCLEYMPKGSLVNLLSGDNLGNNWPIRCKIIKGICEGLKYLQEGLEFPVFHLDLKPDNILLDEKMMPKISDFGLSRLIGEGNTINTLSRLGTIGYIPPEFINHQVISKEYDIYSLGVIMTKIIAGSTGYSIVADMAAQEFVEHVHENWKRCLQEIPRYESLEADCKQVKRCIEIARNCMETDRYKRPTIKDIVSQLDEMGNLEIDSKLPMEKGLLRTKQQKSSNNMHNDPPSEICHPAHPEHKLKLMDDGAPFMCNGCKEPGYGPRYRCDCGGGGQSLDLHTGCALAEDTLVHPLFGYGKLEFRFLHEPPPPVGATFCNACGEPTHGYVYHCFEQDIHLHLHPCCASMPDHIIHDGRAFELRRKASRPCVLCGDNKGHRSMFWAYSSYFDGEVVDLHVACLKENARISWEATNRNRVVGAGAQIVQASDLNIDRILENMHRIGLGVDIVISTALLTLWPSRGVPQIDLFCMLVSALMLMLSRRTLLI
ncbi:G-type lectin S-receptor-like serine/threonine-protein kinase CES101 isoform X2 [Miscanthus floridulus]|uniref:G-type lectin S-receptor-like serine/threonine-protein kinase CES101 isoform X2 n=1 Tax=Miscanthus floridulus TaxID=154761 RepID=UPI00345A9706